MFKKTTALLLVIVMVVCCMCACRVEEDKNAATATIIPVGTGTSDIENETGNETDITVADFDISNLKVGDKVSVFTVTDVDIKNSADGSLGSAVIKFTGSLAVRGSCTVVDESDLADLAVFDEYTSYLPYPVNAVNELKSVALAVDQLNDFYGDDTSGHVAVVIESYSLTYSVEDGEWHAFADEFSKDENEYAVMQ